MGRTASHETFLDATPLRSIPDGSDPGSHTVAAYAKVARPLMRRFMESHNCVCTTRVTCEYFARCWIGARPVSCNFVLKVPVQKYMYLAGWTGREKGLLKPGEEEWIEHAPGMPQWMGHMVALVQDRYLVDASVDQATNPKRGVVVPPLVLVLDLGPGGSVALWRGVAAAITFRNGITAAANYVGIHEHNFLQSKAWCDDAAAREVAVLIEHAVAGSLLPW